MSGGKPIATMGSAWEAVATTVSRIEGMHGRASWRCRACGLIVSGAPARIPPERCPVCAAGTRRRFDEHMCRLVDSYRAAKAAAADDEADHAVVSNRGNYDVDGEASSPDSESLRSDEHRSALAIADAVLAQLDRPSLA